MKRLRRVHEPEVIAEFLKNEFFQEEFHADRSQFEHLVMDANISNERDNALRRALLFRRRGHMWRELPADTQWWEVTLEPEDLSLIRVFPRAQWRCVSDGSFQLTDITERIATADFPGEKTRTFIAKVHDIASDLQNGKNHSSVLLIGIDEMNPLTILEGNHRLTAALLASPELVQTSFRILCGFSPNMATSCWYETNFPNLWRYAKNRLRNLFYDREADVYRILNEKRAPTEAEPGFNEAAAFESRVGAQKAIPGSK
ncbi:MAG: hypothetical protein ROO76_01110 [Terriglobia bacterium]|jgi:hypothetical protein|nr:hypothetical protein [Terriglobia bacterium]